MSGIGAWTADSAALRKAKDGQGSRTRQWHDRMERSGSVSRKFGRQVGVDRVARGLRACATASFEQLGVGPVTSLKTGVRTDGDGVRLVFASGGHDCGLWAV
jgi:hypothetical protein